MKKVLFLALAVCGLTLMSCKKCQTCTTTTAQSLPGIPTITTSTSQEYCGDDYDSAPPETSVTQDIGGGTSQTVTIDCVDD
jgi:hypothetical protein